jgi:hypothetical protein
MSGFFMILWVVMSVGNILGFADGNGQAYVWTAIWLQICSAVITIFQLQSLYGGSGGTINSNQKKTMKESSSRKISIPESPGSHREQATKPDLHRSA